MIKKNALLNYESPTLECPGIIPDRGGCLCASDGYNAEGSGYLISDVTEDDTYSDTEWL